MKKEYGWLLLTIAIVAFCSAIILSANWKRKQRPPVLPNDQNNARALQDVKPQLRELPLLGDVPEFRLGTGTTAALGNVDLSPPGPAVNDVSSHQLLGRAWLVHFTTPDSLNLNTTVPSFLKNVQSRIQTGDMANDVRLVSIVSVESAQPNWTPETAARNLGTDDLIWKIAEGSNDDVHALHQAFLDSATADASVTENSIILVDPQGMIRAGYDGSKLPDPGRAIADLRVVLNERVMLLNKQLEVKSPNHLMFPAWLERRREMQMDTLDKFEVFHSFWFTDQRAESGIRFKHRIVDDAGRSLVTAHYDHGNGLAAADVNGDELIDLYFVNQVGGNQLWQNLGGGKFADITDSAGVSLKERISVSASFADVDNDGDADLYVTTVRGGNALYENDGSGNFRDITEPSGLSYSGHSSGAVFFDYDRDGKLDLFLVNVGKFTTEKQLTVVNDRITGPDDDKYTYYASNPDAFAAHLKPERAEQSILYHNEGDLRFVDVSAAMNLVDLNWTGDATAADLNADQWPDLYLVNMQGHDEYYENVEGTRFERKGRELFPATPWGSMGLKAFDFENDGDLDVYITDMHTDMAKDLSPMNEDEKIDKDNMDPDMLNTDGNHVWGNAFFLNEGNGQFTEASDQLGVENYWPWGFSAEDLNADGYVDLFVTTSMSFPFRYSPNRLLLNNRGKQFLSSEFLLGVEPRRDGQTAIPWFELDLRGSDRSHPITRLLRDNNIHVSRAVVWGALGSRSSVVFDLENDGDLDIVTNEFNAPPMVLVSNLSKQQPTLQYLRVALAGKSSNRDGLGAEVRLRTGDETLLRVNDGKSGFLSQSRVPLYFGLGDRTQIDALEVTWPSGQKQIVEGPIELNTTIVIEEAS